ncbi:MAG: transglycosylase domain-containing protein [Acetatifactor sp.]|nr:transglycosylase domain-containing protein [Acetatifactor sp.]
MEKKQRKHKKIQHVVKKVLCSVFILTFTVYLVCGAFFSFKGYGMYWKAVHDKPLETRVEEIRSREEFTPYSQLPQFYIDATISVEDHRFARHFGVDPIAIGRALWTDLKAQRFVEGGSTITQQLAKNLLFSAEKRIERKVAEVFAALKIEAQYTKQEIFELYVNQAYYGNGYYGIYQASMGYFGKEPSELTDYESAILAGVLNAPSAYAPNAHPGLAQQRAGQVLNSMIKHGVISREEAEKIKEER